MAMPYNYEDNYLDKLLDYSNNNDKGEDDNE